MNPYTIVRKLRRDKNIRQAEIAKHIGITQSNYAKLENGKIELTISKLEKISEFLKVHPVEILYPGTFSGENRESIEKVLLEKLESSYQQSIQSKDELIEELKEKALIYKSLLDKYVKKK
jgi:transcriptional regulator with XRE-family HTH domain